MNSRDNKEQDDDDGEIEVGFEEQVLTLLKDHTQCIQGLINNQDKQASTNEHTLEILQELAARIERLEQNT